MIQTKGKMQRLSCDGLDCNKVTPWWDKTMFHQMINSAKDRGWLVYKKDGKWRHGCSHIFGGKCGNVHK